MEDSRGAIEPVGSWAILGQAVALGCLIAATRAFGFTWEANTWAAALVGAALVVWLASRRVLVDLSAFSAFAGPSIRWVAAVTIGAAAAQYVLDVVGWVGAVDLGNSAETVLAMMMIGLAASTLIYVSSLIDWFYVLPHLQGARGPVCTTSTGGIWRWVTRVRLVHRIGAVLGFLVAATALIALAANQWIRPIDEVAAGAIGSVATIVAGYYIARAAPLIALTMNPCVHLADVVELAEQFNAPEAGRQYFVVDLAWEGCKLREVLPSGELKDSRVGFDRMIDIADVAKLIRRRQEMVGCRGACRHLVEQCLVRPGAGASDA